MTSVERVRGGAQTLQAGRAGQREPGREIAPLPVIDCDVHEMMRSIDDLSPYLVEPWRSRLGPDGWRGTYGIPYSWPTTGGGARTDAKSMDGAIAGSDINQLRSQLLDKHNVQYVNLISMFHPTDITVQSEFAVALATAYNDWLVENWLDQDARLRGSITIAAQVPEAAAEEIHRRAEHPSFVQVLLPASSRVVFGVSYYHPIFAAAEEHGLPVAFHQTGGTATSVGYPPYYIEWHTAISQAWQCQLLGLIFHGVLDKFPELTVVLVESGWTWLPALMWRADLNYKSLRREVPWVKEKPSTYMSERIRITTHPTEDTEDPRDLYRMFEMIGNDSILLFSSDYPHWDFDSPLTSLPAAFSKDLRRKVLYTNALDVYRY